MYIVLGTALDGISMIVLTTAVVLPMVKKAGFDLVWFGIFVVLIVEMAEVSPPVGFNLFVLQTMSGKDSNTVARAALPFFFLLVVAVAIITVFPQIVMGLPRMAFPGLALQPEGDTAMTTLLKSLALAAPPSHWRPAPRTRRPSGTCPAAYPADNPHTENLVAFAKDVEGRDRRQAEDHGPSRRLAVQGAGDQARGATGQAQMGEVLLSIHENEDPIFGIDVVPFLATSFPDAMKLYKASKPAIEKKLAAQGLMLLFAVPWAPQGIYAKKDLNTIDDMKGLKWRAYNVGTTRIGELVGAQSVTIQAAELPQALATGVVNSFMSSGGTGYDTKVWETLTHFYDVQAWIPKNFTFVNKAAFDALDKPTQEAILKAAATAETRGWKAWEDKANWYLDQLKAKGMKVQAPSPALKAGFKKVGEQLTADWLKKAGADGQAMVDAYKKM